MLTILRVTALLALISVFVFLKPEQAHAKTYNLPDGTIFDSDFYAAMYPEMQAAYAGGKYPERLLWHYLTYGINEGRIPSMFNMYYRTPATMATQNVYPANYPYVVPVQYLYPYTPYYLYCY